MMSLVCCSLSPASIDPGLLRYSRIQQTSKAACPPPLPPYHCWLKINDCIKSVNNRVDRKKTRLCLSDTNVAGFLSSVLLPCPALHCGSNKQRLWCGETYLMVDQFSHASEAIPCPSQQHLAAKVASRLSFGVRWYVIKTLAKVYASAGRKSLAIILAKMNSVSTCITC